MEVLTEIQGRSKHTGRNVNIDQFSPDFSFIFN